MSAHTPGPWGTNSKYGTGKRIPIVQRGQHDRTALAWVDADDVPESESQANVALIIAAPDLLAACEALVDHLTALYPDSEDARLEAARAAIAKARGQS